MKDLPSVSRLSPAMSTVFTPLSRYILHSSPFYLLLSTPPPPPPPQFTRRKPFWDYLQNLAFNISLPWLLLGDFNDMISEEEKLGGLPINRTRMTAFRNCLDKCGLIDLGFHGPRFTWTNKSPVWQSTIKERRIKEWPILNGLCSFLLRKFTIFLESNRTTAQFCLPLNLRGPNSLNPFALNICSLRTPPSPPSCKIASTPQN